MPSRRGLALVALIMFTACLGISERSPAQESPVSAEEYYRRMTGNPNLKTNPKGESFCWHAASGMHTFVSMFEATGDRNWLDWGVQYYDFLIGNLDTGPDGYRGWIGPYMYDKQYWCDVHVGDAILWKGILDFSVLVHVTPALKQDYGEKARSYVELASRHCMEKWDSRGTWREDGPVGAYASFTKYLAPGDLTSWRFGAEVTGSDLSLPFNKQNDMAQVALRLYRITGKKAFRVRAEKIFLRMKRSFQYFDDHYVWNYWEPFGPWDIDRGKNLPRHWVGVHPYRNYQAGEVDQIVDAYHAGIVFDERDIRRIINTNLKVMWNGDRNNPRFRNSNITHVPEKQPPAGSGYTSTAGTLWTGLLGFSAELRELYTLRFGESRSPSPERVRYEKVIAATPPGFGRKHVRGKIAVVSVDFTESPELNMATAIPQVVPRNAETLLVCKAWSGADTLEIALYSKNGGRKIRTLERVWIEGGNDGLTGIHIFSWDGSDPVNRRLYRGDYRIRWTFGTSCREFPVNLK